MALDTGWDPEQNVLLVETDKEFRLSLSDEFDMYMREEPGEWRWN